MKYVIYDITNMEVIRLTNEDVDITKLKQNEDFDLVSTWMLIDTYKNKIQEHMSISM